MFGFIGKSISDLGVRVNTNSVMSGVAKVADGFGCLDGLIDD